MMGSIKRTCLVEISIDVSNEQINNSIRVLTCVNSRNISSLEATADLLYSRGVRDWSVSWTLFAGRARFIYDSLVAKETASVLEAITRVRLKYPDMRVKFSNRSNSGENNLYSFLVFPNGRAFAEDLSQGKKIPYESLLEKPLEASWITENYNIQKHFERWTSGRVYKFTDQ